MTAQQLGTVRVRLHVLRIIRDHPGCSALLIARSVKYRQRDGTYVTFNQRTGHYAYRSLRFLLHEGLVTRIRTNTRTKKLVGFTITDQGSNWLKANRELLSSPLPLPHLYKTHNTILP